MVSKATDPTMTRLMSLSPVLAQIFAAERAERAPRRGRDRPGVRDDRVLQGGAAVAAAAGLRAEGRQGLLEDGLGVADVVGQVPEDELDRDRLLGLVPAVIIRGRAQR